MILTFTVVLGLYVLGMLCAYLSPNNKVEIGFLAFSVYFKALAFSLAVNISFNITHYRWISFLAFAHYFIFQAYVIYRSNKLRLAKPDSK